ncbi:nucleotidyltransferase [Paenibacillus thalictri]|uniref:tRNA(Met) cytidine acetate ligase n=1 Tax=Paenibacillus thalictri TaxID=2527873 RepID=A0A4Q9DNM8_9BACL|nr:nucleotidyltransferase [Paenibacillus thalictri]TBL77686.1 nucleotidyltransferase [Paenibacillus thalictri]
MNTVGLIVEYNPLHNGHAYHFRESKRSADAEAAVAVMSGHFLQRGEPAIVNKWARAEMALEMGADLVLELPAAYASQPAEWFAYGAVSALDATGVVDSLCFGSESGDISALDVLSGHLAAESDAFKALIREELKGGLPYPAAYSRAAARLLPGVDPAELSKPNNTLGLHYLISLKRLQSNIRPLTITRQKAGYNQTTIDDAQIASATAIRKLLLEERRLDAVRPFVPESTYRILLREWECGRGPITWDNFSRPLLHQLLGQTAEDLAAFYEVAEGLEHRIKMALPRLRPDQPLIVEQLLAQLKTKRYTLPKLQRMLLRILLGHRKQQLDASLLRQGVPYLRVLGFSETGQQLLKRMKTTAKVPVVSKVGGAENLMLEMDIRASSMYALAYRDAQADDLFRDYYQPPIRPSSYDFGSSCCK